MRHFQQEQLRSQTFGWILEFRKKIIFVEQCCFHLFYSMYCVHCVWHIVSEQQCQYKKPHPKLDLVADMFPCVYNG